MSENVGSIEYYVDANTRGLLKAEKQVDRSTRNMEQGFDRTETSAKKLERGLGSLSKVAAAVITTVAINQLTAYADAFTNVQNKLRVVTDSSDELASITEKLVAVSKDARSNFESTSDLYSKLARSTEELGVSNERLLAITSTISKSFTLAGSTAIEASNAIRQLGQGLSAGALRGDEFNSVAEQAPGILRAVAAETGKTIGELREFAAEGGITSELLIRSVENYAETVEREFSKTNATFSQSAEIARTNAIEFVGASDLIANTVGGAGSALVTLSENLDTLSDVLLAGAVILTGRYVGALTASTTAMVSKTTATIASARADVAATVEAKRRALVDQIGAKRALEVAANTTLRAQAITRLAAANQTVVATTTAATAAQARYNAVATIGTKVTNGLRGAMALLGGPAGLIFLAASSLAYFAVTADDASDKSEKLNAELATMEDRLKGMNQAEKDILFTKLAQEASDVRAEIAKTTKALAKAESDAVSGARGSGSGGQIQQLTRKLVELDGQLTSISKKQEAVFNQGLNSNLGEWQSLTEGTKEANEELDKFTQKIEDQIFAIKNGAQAFEILQAQRQASVDASSAEGQEIARLVRLRDSEAASAKAQAEAQRQAQDAKESAANATQDLAEKTRANILGMLDSDKAFEMHIDKIRATATAAGENADEIERLIRAEKALKEEQDAQSKVDQITQEVALMQMRNDLSNEEYELQLAIAQLGSNASQQQIDSLTMQIEKMQQLRLESQLTGQSLGEAFQGIGVSALNDFSDGLANAIVQGESMDDMLKGLARSIVTDLLSAIIRYWVGQAAASLLGIGQSTAAAVAGGSAAAAAWGPAATLASIATLGGAAATGSAALGGALAATKAMSVASSVPLGGGRLYGGGVEAGTMYPITENGRPEILTQGGKQYLLPGDRGRVTSNRDMATNNDNSNISVTMPISVYGDASSQDIRNALFDQEDLIYDIVERAKAKRGIM